MPQPVSGAGRRRAGRPQREPPGFRTWHRIGEWQWQGSACLFFRLLPGCEFRKDDSEIVESAAGLAAIRQPPALLQYNGSLAVNYRQVGTLRSSGCPCPGKDGCHCLVISDYLFSFLRRNLIPRINESQNRNIRGFCRLLHQYPPIPSCARGGWPAQTQTQAAAGCL